MNTNKKNRQTKTHYTALILVAALALLLASSPAAAQPFKNLAPGQDAERVVSRAFAQLDGLIARNGCVEGSLVQQLDQMFIELADWDARSRLHSTAYPVCAS